MLPIIFMAPIGGHLRDRYGSKKPMSWGALLVILSLIRAFISWFPWFRFRYATNIIGYHGHGNEYG